MILTDTGPLIALINQREPEHLRCVRVLGAVRPPLITSWPVMAEAMYLLARVGGWPAQRALWSLVAAGTVEIAPIAPQSITRMQTLMDRYSNVPMDLADASLVALAEDLGHTRVFTLDSDFHIYRLQGNRAITVIP